MMRDYIYLISHLSCFLLYLMLLLVYQNIKTLLSIVQRYMPWRFFGILERQSNCTLYIIIWYILSNKCIFSCFPQVVLPINTKEVMNRLTQKLLIQLCLKVILCLGLYTTMQLPYTCLFGNKVNNIFFIFLTVNYDGNNRIP